jgi:hypothetical protein
MRIQENESGYGETNQNPRIRIQTRRILFPAGKTKKNTPYNKVCIGISGGRGDLNTDTGKQIRNLVSASKHGVFYFSQGKQKRIRGNKSESPYPHPGAAYFISRRENKKKYTI